jgi:hypothetical protein
MAEKSNEQLYEQAVADLYGTAIRQTEQEIAEDALGLAPDENNYDHELEMAEGWDGEPISDTELAYAAATDDGTGSGYDRQLQLHEDLELIDENRLLREERDDANALLDEIQNGPAARQAAHENFKEELWQRFGIMGVDDNKIAALRQTFQNVSNHASTQIDEHQRVNLSLHAARSEDPESFDEAYQALMRAGQDGDNAAVRSVFYSPNPGRSLMRWRGGGEDFANARGLVGARNQAPSRRSGRMPGREDIDRMRSGFGDAGVEQDIADSVWS